MTPFDVNTPPTEPSGRATDAWLQTLVTHFPHAILAADNEGCIQVVNPEFCRYFSVSGNQESWYGKKTAEVFAAMQNYIVNGSDFIQRVKSIQSFKKAQRNELVIMKDGRKLLCDYSPIWQQGVVTGHLWLFNDQTSRIDAEARLTEQRDFFEGVLDSIPSDIAIFSPDHKYLYINPVGLGDAELRKWLIGKNDFDYCMMRGKDISFAQNRRDIFNDIIKTGKEKEWEERIVNKRGEVEYHLRKLSP
jgi:PAS domain-containing protein